MEIHSYPENFPKHKKPRSCVPVFSKKPHKKPEILNKEALCRWKLRANLSLGNYISKIQHNTIKNNKTGRQAHPHRS